MQSEISARDVSVQAQVPDSAPLMKAWRAYEYTDRFDNTKRWAQIEGHTHGSLWAAFEEGWNARTLHSRELRAARPWWFRWLARLTERQTLARVVNLPREKT